MWAYLLWFLHSDLVEGAAFVFFASSSFTYLPLQQVHPNDCMIYRTSVPEDAQFPLRNFGLEQVAELLIHILRVYGHPHWKDNTGERITERTQKQECDPSNSLTPIVLTGLRPGNGNRSGHASR